MGIFLNSMRGESLPSGVYNAQTSFVVVDPPIQNFQGCLVAADDPILSWYWILLMMYEGGKLAIMLFISQHIHSFSSHVTFDVSKSLQGM